MRKPIKRALPADKDVKRRSINWVAIPALISLIVPFLYAIGRAYDNGYFYIYGINADLFERSTQDYLFLGICGVFQTSWTTALNLTHQFTGILIVAVVLSGVILYYLLLADIKKVDSDRDWTKHHPFLAKVAKSVFGGVLGALFIYIFLLTVSLMIAGVMSIGQSAGKDVAQSEIDRDKDICAVMPRKNLSACVLVKRNGQKVAMGRVIGSSSTLIAVAQEGIGTVLNKANLSFEVFIPELSEKNKKLSDITE